MINLLRHMDIIIEVQSLILTQRLCVGCFQQRTALHRIRKHCRETRTCRSLPQCPHAQTKCLLLCQNKSQRFVIRLRERSASLAKSKLNSVTSQSANSFNDFDSSLRTTCSPSENRVRTLHYTGFTTCNNDESTHNYRKIRIEEYH